MRLIYLLVLLLNTNVLAATTKMPDIKDFAKDDQWQDVQISPGGEYLSAVTKVEGIKVIVMINAKTLKVMHSLKFSGFAQPGDYRWASNDRIVAEKELLKGWTDHPVSYGEYYSVGVKGGKAKYIFGYQTATQSMSKNMWGELVAPMPDDNRFILVKGTRMSDSKDYLPKVYRVDLKNARKKVVAESPVSRGVFLTDQHHNLRFVTGYDKDNNHTTWLYKDEKWLGTADLNIDNESFYPISIKGDTNQVYAYYTDNDKPTGLYLFDLDSGKKQKIFQHPRVSLTGYKVDKAGEVYAVEYDDGYPNTKILNGNHPDAKALQSIMKDLPGNSISVLSETLDGNTKVVLAHNQFNAGDFLLYNGKTGQLDYLFSKRSWVNADIAANVVPFKFKARDGIDIAGYVTLPLGADTLKQAKNLPFVVNVHGGPHGIRDHMIYDPENQLYASRGIAVLQVNYRGSGGYGQKFLELGYKHWGDTIQYDIIDGIKALVSQGVADKNRLCMLGSSFGGYSALQSSIIAPDLFQCAVGVMGVYDLELMHAVGDIRRRATGRAYLDKVIGTDKKVLKANSPVHNLDKLKIPVLIVHGGNDKRVPVEHAELLKEGLEKQGVAHEWMLLDDEGHGFYKPEHRASVYKRTLKFLAQHLKLK